uniref:peptidylprolyl isomerase n=1 Tax=Leptobrachium leishanense TaxID=445787 RepID=A0A8C5MSI8_9ANUR
MALVGLQQLWLRLGSDERTNCTVWTYNVTTISVKKYQLILTEKKKNNCSCFLENGSHFHSTYTENNQPVWFTLGIREVIKGWDKGLKDMCVGEKRKLAVPAVLAYGKEGKGKIPPDSNLIFHIDLMEIRNGPRSHESFQEMDLNDDWKLSKAEVKEYLRKEFQKHGNSVNDSQHDVLLESIFDKEDEDHDGFISAREFTYEHDEL